MRTDVQLKFIGSSNINSLLRQILLLRARTQLHFNLWAYTWYTPRFLIQGKRSERLTFIFHQLAAMRNYIQGNASKSL